MNKKAFKYVACFAIIALVGMYVASMLNVPKVYAESEAPPNGDESGSFTPLVWKPEWIDQDNNGIADTLDQEIADRIANGTAQEYVNVTVILSSEPTAYDAEAFAMCSGYVTTDPWTYATYGFGGMITYEGIMSFAQQCSDLLLIEKEAAGQANIAYAAQQVGARTYVWNTMGLQGDSQSSIAILDTGIDETHPDFSPGFGSGDFSKKIVGWNDQITIGTTSPYDDNGHGSHCAGLAAGNGFFSVDASGYATATWGANLGTIVTSGTYLITGMMVNSPGTITIRVKWTSTSLSPSAGRVTALPLYYGNKTLSTGSWTPVASVSTPTRDTWYTLTYTVPSTPSGGYDMYHPLLTLASGPGSLYVVFTVSWPYTPPADGFSAWTGIAPQAKLVGVKVLNHAGSGTSTGLVSGINWIIANRMTYRITVASMSLGFTSEVAAVNTAVVNLVNSGVTTVCAAGNSGSGANYIYTPGSVDEVITVAAMNQFDMITSYSSQGGQRSGKQTVKPDITAPGGSFYAVPLFSADSNDQDADNRWPDTVLNDSAPMQGTSMSTPVVAGAVNIVQQAMGGYSNWQWTRAQALQPKMILLMTATETFPNLREPASTAAPTLQRGGKDVHEGYGRMNLDVAVDAVLRTYAIGTTVTDTLGRPPTLTDISVLGQKLAWARNVQLVSGYRYTFTLSVPAGADYDLYLYNNTGRRIAGSYYGEPGIVASSTTPAIGGTEQITITSAPYTGTYYLVVKRATATTGAGAFTLTSSGPVLVTLNTLGLESASNVVRYIQNGITKTGSVSVYTFSDYVDTGTTLSIDNPIYVSASERFYTTDQTSFAITASATFTVSYTRQYYLTVNTSPYGVTTPSGEGWYDARTYGSISTLEYIYTAPDTRYRFDGWTGEDITNSASPSTTVLIDKAKTVTANYVLQYYLTVTSPYGEPAPSSNWFDSGTSITASVTSPVSGPAGTRYVCTGWTGTGSVPTSGTENSVTFTINTPSSITWNWKTQYLLTVSTTPSGLTPQPVVTPPGYASGGGWYDTGTVVSINPDSPAGYTFICWLGDASGSDVPLYIAMDSPKTIVAVFKFNLAVETVFKPGNSPPFASSPYLEEILCVLTKSTGGYKLAGTSPGTFDYGVTIKNTGTTTFTSITINVIGSNDFCLHSSSPIRVLDENGNVITYQFTISGTWPTITIKSNAAFQGLSSGASLYVTFHLDYTLKGTIVSQSEIYQRAYTFKTTVSGTSEPNTGMADAYGSVAVLSKKTTMIYGFVTTNGIPIANAKVELWRDGTLLYTTYTDTNGFFCFIDGWEGVKLSSGVTYIVRCTMPDGTIMSNSVIAQKDTAVAVNFAQRKQTITIL